MSTAIAGILNTFGPRMKFSDGRAIPAFIHQALRGEPITVAGTGRQTRSACAGLTAADDARVRNR